MSQTPSTRWLQKLVQKRVDGYFREPGTEFNEFESNKLRFESVI